MNLTSICGEPYSSSDHFLKELKFWGPGVSVPIIGTIGLVGNALSVYAIATFPKSKLTLFYKVNQTNCR